MFSFLARTLGACAMLFGALVSGAHAADFSPLTLRDAIEFTLDRNPDLKGFAYELRARDARIQQAILKPAPTLSVEIENVLGSGNFRGADAAEATLSLSQVIELGGKREARVAVAQFGREAVTLEHQAAQLDVLAEVARRFIHVAADQEQQKLTLKATELAQQTVAAVQARVKAAKSPEVELHRARITLARTEVEREHAEHELRTSRRKLAAMWGDTKPGFGAVEADLYAVPAAGSFEALLARLDGNPDFTRFASEARLRDAEIRLAQTRNRGDIELIGGLRRLELTQDQALIAGISIPLFATRQAIPLIAEAEALREKTDAARQAAKIRAQAQLFELHQELKHAITETELLRGIVIPEMDEALRETQYAYERGRYSYLEWVEAQREFLAVRRSLIEAAANAHNYRIEIERLTAEPLGESSGGARTEIDDAHTQQTDADAQPVGRDRANAVHSPQPGQRRANVNPSISGVDAPGRLRVQGEQPSEGGQAQGSRQQQPRTATLLKPEIRQIAADDLGKSRTHE